MGMNPSVLPTMIKCVPDDLVLMSHLAGVVVTPAQLLLDENEMEGKF